MRLVLPFCPVGSSVDGVGDSGGGDASGCCFDPAGSDVIDERLTTLLIIGKVGSGLPFSPSFSDSDSPVGPAALSVPVRVKGKQSR